MLSNRADVISGGDALVQVARPSDAAASALEVTVGGRDVTGSGAAAAGWWGWSSGLAVGQNVVTARLADGPRRSITITNHPIGGPVFAGRRSSRGSATRSAAGRTAAPAPTVVPVGLGPPRDAQCNTAAGGQLRLQGRGDAGDVHSLRPEEPAGRRRRSRRRRPTRARRSPTSSARRTACRTAASTRSRCSTPPARGTTSC